MVARAVSEGRGIDGLMSYLTHDKVSPGDRYPKTDERVAWAVPIGGSPTADVALCVRIMQGVTADAAMLKQLAGASRRGRKLRNPYAHFMTSWPPGEIPSREEMLEVAARQLKALECTDRLAIALAHTDTEHAHFHLVVCKVHPDTGLAATLNHSGLQLSRVAEQWEREHGGIVIENRVRRNEARAAYAVHVDRYMEQHYKPDPNASLDDQATHYDEILRKARAEARELHPLPPMEPKRRSRNVDGQPVQTPEPERQFWSELHEQQRAENLPEPDHRKQRVEASRLLRHGAAPRVGPEPAASVPAAPTNPFPVPSRVMRVGPEPVASVPATPTNPFPVPSRVMRVGPEPVASVPAAPTNPFPVPSRAMRVGPEPVASVPATPTNPFPVPSRVMRVGPEPVASVPAAPTNPFPVPSRAMRVGPEPAAVSVPASPEQPCPSAIRGSAVQVLADLSAAVTPEPVYPDPDVLDEIADQLARDHPGAPMIEMDSLMLERHSKELSTGALDGQVERRQACEKTIVDRLWIHNEGKPLGSVPQEYGTVGKWAHALVDLIQALVRKLLFPKQRDDRIDTGQDDPIDTGQDDPIDAGDTPAGRQDPLEALLRKAGSEQQLSKIQQDNALRPDAGCNVGVDRPVPKTLDTPTGQQRLKQR